MGAVEDQKRRADRVWQDRAPWDRLYRDAYEYALPMRRPSASSVTKSVADKIFDMTATQSAMYFAGNLQRDLFPAGQAPFRLETGKLARMAIGPDEAKRLDRELERLSTQMHPFFTAGDWDTAMHETCIDLGVGTGAIMPVKGTRDEPVVFASIPFDSLAIENDMWGRLAFASWKQVLSREAIRTGFPDGHFDREFLDAAREKPNGEVTLYQDFWRLPGRAGWRYAAYTEKAPAFIVEAATRTQPLAVPRYYRVPGEAYGRGPILLALPSIKTLNKGQELALKAASIQMLGIWGFRAGGTFNPDTVRVGPGEFWPMQSTGGILGPDVQRIDPASGRIDVAKWIVGGLQDQIRAALFDTRLPEEQGTPRSASEIVARLRQKAEVHIGAFGRLVREIMPAVVPRVAEILYEFGYLQTPLRIDDFMIAIQVQSPMQAALNAERLASIANYIEFVGAVAGPQALELYAHVDRVMDLVAKGQQIPADLIPTDEERATIRQRQEAQQAQMLALDMARNGAKGIEQLAGAAAA